MLGEKGILLLKLRSMAARFSAVLMAMTMWHAALWAGVGKNEARYMGGAFTDVKPGAEGSVRVGDEVAVFAWGKQKYTVPFTQITSLEYGQKAGRRIGAAVGLGITTLGLMALPILLSKKRKHFATIGYKDEAGKPQALLVEFGKDVNRVALKMMSLKSGVKLEFESEQAEKDFRN